MMGDSLIGQWRGFWYDACTETSLYFYRHTFVLTFLPRLGIIHVREKFGYVESSLWMPIQRQVLQAT